MLDTTKDYSKKVITQIDVIDNNKGDSFIIELVVIINKEGLIESYSYFQVRIDPLQSIFFTSANLSGVYNYIKSVSLQLY